MQAGAPLSDHSTDEIGPMMRVTAIAMDREVARWSTSVRMIATSRFVPAGMRCSVRRKKPTSATLSATELSPEIQSYLNRSNAIAEAHARWQSNRGRLGCHLEALDVEPIPVVWAEDGNAALASAAAVSVIRHTWQGKFTKACDNILEARPADALWQP
jgi:hypothetical protein